MIDQLSVLITLNILFMFAVIFFHFMVHDFLFLMILKVMWSLAYIIQTFSFHHMRYEYLLLHIRKHTEKNRHVAKY